MLKLKLHILTINNIHFNFGKVVNLFIIEHYF